MEVVKDISLVKEEIPEPRGARVPMYMKYRELLKEFLDSGWETARADGVEVGRESSAMAACARKLFPNVKVRTRKGKVYLERVE